MNAGDPDRVSIRMLELMDKAGDADSLEDNVMGSAGAICLGLMFVMKELRAIRLLLEEKQKSGLKS